MNSGKGRNTWTLPVGLFQLLIQGEFIMAEGKQATTINICQQPTKYRKPMKIKIWKPGDPR
jgi:hypothetical protein